MASVTSLDQDMRRLRLDRYTPQAANEVRSWIEKTLGESLAPGDLLESLKDGVALCKLANMLLPPPGIKFKASTMPFTQRENISHFLTACERDPLSLPAHDRFLTVDLYDNKDPAQVIQCIGAFSRAANAVNPSKFPAVIGPKRQASPTRNPPANRSVLSESNGYNRGRAASNASQGSEFSPDGKRASSPTLTDVSSTSRSTGAVSSWSKKSDEASSSPAWNIHQYGYMGGASQGNQGISFGARRQITSPGVSVPSLTEKEKIRKEEQVEAERRRAEVEQADLRRRAEFEDRERRERIAEEQRWEEETRKAREREKQEVEEQRKKWEEEERQWQEEEEQRRKRSEAKAPPPISLKGQYLSQYQSEQRKLSPGAASSINSDPQNDRIQELERQLEEAKERERQYQLERDQRGRRPQTPQRTSESPDTSNSYRRPRSLSPEKPEIGSSKPDAWAPDSALPETEPTIPVIETSNSPPVSSSMLPTEPKTSSSLPRPLPEPAVNPLVSSELPAAPSPFTRTDRFLARNPAPLPSTPKSHFSAEMGMTSSTERAAEDARRVASQTKTKAGGWASKSLLEREMERERERQREWEEAQIGRAAQPGNGKVMGPRELKQ